MRHSKNLREYFAERGHSSLLYPSSAKNETAGHRPAPITADFANHFGGKSAVRMRPHQCPLIWLLDSSFEKQDAGLYSLRLPSLSFDRVSKHIYVGEIYTRRLGQRVTLIDGASSCIGKYQVKNTRLQNKYSRL